MTYYCGCCGQAKADDDKFQVKLLSKPICSKCWDRLDKVHGLKMKKPKPVKKWHQIEMY